MARSVGRRWTFWLGATGIVLIAVLTAALQRDIRRVWYVRGLDSEDRSVRLAAVASLETLGDSKAIEPLLALAQGVDDSSQVHAALKAVETLVDVGRPDEQEMAVRRLLTLAAARPQDSGQAKPPDGEPRHDAYSVLLRVGSRLEAGYALLLAVLLRGDVAEARNLAADCLVSGWPKTRNTLERYLDDAPSSQLRDLYLLGGAVERGLYAWPQLNQAAIQAMIAQQQQKPVVDPSVSFTSIITSNGTRFTFTGSQLSIRLHLEERLLEIALEFAKSHPRPEARAVSLGYAVALDHDPESSLLRERAATDQHLVERRTAIRLSGFLGHSSRSVDLQRAFREEPIDSPLLEDLIRARDLWSLQFYTSADVDLGFGLLERSLAPAKNRATVEWTKAERTRLATILAQSPHPGVRDAASGALAGFARRRGPGETLADTTVASQSRGLTVHEWGVWRDGGNVLGAARRALAELPPFVHRSKVTASAYSEARKESVSVVFKPVLFFYTDVPRSVYASVHFFRGRPWSYFPQKTDDVHSQVRSAALGAGFARLDRPGLLPPWSKDVLANGGTVGGTRQAGWLFPPSPRLVGALTGLGLEWRGLRVGYNDRHEAALADVPGDSWWQALRDVGASSVAVRGERERFLFYDGPVGVQGPVEPVWTDATKATLALRVRPYSTFPDLEWTPWVDTMLRDGLDTAVPIPAVLVVQVDADGARGKLLHDLSPKAAAARVDPSQLSIGHDELVGVFRTELVEQGLSEAEALSLYEAWRSEFFETQGLRVISFLPRWMYDVMLPLRILPTPDALERVGLVWTECENLPVVVEPDRLPPLKMTWDAAPVIETVEGAIADGLSPWQDAGVRRVEGSGFNADGSFTVRAGEFSFRASPSGRFVLVRLDAERPSELYLLDFDTKTLQHLGAFPGGQNLGTMAVNATGEFAVVPQRSDEGWGLVLLDVARNRKRVLAFEREYVRNPVLSDDGTKFAFVSSTRLRLLALDSPRRWSIAGEFARAPLSISADGWQVSATVRTKDYREGCWVVDFRRRARCVLPLSQGENAAPKLSADGRSLWFETTRERDSEVYTLDMTSGEVENVTRRFHDDWLHGLSADGQRALVRSRKAFEVLDRKGKRLLHAGDPHSAQLLRDGRRLLVREREDGKVWRLRFVDLESD